MTEKPNLFPLFIKCTAAVTSLITAVLAAVYCLHPVDWLLSAAISFGTTAYHFVMRLAVGTLVPGGSRFDHRCAWFQPRSWEAGLYRLLRVKSWKGRIPTYDPSQFSTTACTLAQIVGNMCSAEVVHEVIIVLSFVPLGFTPLFGAFPVFLITSVIAALYDSIFVIAQRYNRPRLVRILEKQEARRHG